MKKQISRMLGVTLLEIMLVLAIAAMVVVMSIRYYSTATNSQQANSLLSQILAISAAADNLAQGKGSYSGITSTSVSSITGPYYNPWGSTYTLAGAGSTYTFSLNNLPTAVCQSVAAKLAIGEVGSRYKSGGCTSGTLTYVYSLTPTS